MWLNPKIRAIQLKSAGLAGLALKGADRIFNIFFFSTVTNKPAALYDTTECLHVSEASTPLFDVT